MFPIHVRRNPKFLFEHVLKIRLAGKTEVAADLTDGFVRVGQQRFCLFQLAAHDKSVHLESELPLKTAREIGAAFADIGCHIRGGDCLVGVLLDILDALVNVRSGVAGDLRLCHTACKIQHHVVLHLVNRLRTLEFFAFLDIDIAELIGGFDVKAALDRAAGNQCDYGNQDIFCLPQGIVRNPPCLYGECVGEESFSPSMFPLRI